jgi:hypothetical protein
MISKIAMGERILVAGLAAAVAVLYVIDMISGVEAAFLGGMSGVYLGATFFSGFFIPTSRALHSKSR